MYATKTLQGVEFSDAQESDQRAEIAATLRAAYAR